MKKSNNALLIIIFAVCFVVSMCTYADAEKDDQENIWVAVSLFDGRNRTVVEYYGVMQKSIFDGITINSITEGFFKLDNTSWMTDEGVVLMRDSKNAGRSSGYSGETYMLVKTITRIIALEKEFVKNNLLPRFEKETKPSK